MRRLISTVLLMSALGCTNDDVYRAKHIEPGKGEAYVVVRINRDTKFTTVRITYPAENLEVTGTDADGNEKYESIRGTRDGNAVFEYPVKEKAGSFMELIQRGVEFQGLSAALNGAKREAVRDR